MTDPRVTVFHQPGCPFAAKLRAKLAVARIPHRAVPFRSDETGAALVRRHNDGNEISPTVRVDDAVWFPNPTLREIRRALAPTTSGD